jgi:hypothetical protein
MVLFTGFASGKIATYRLMDNSLRKASAVSVGVAVQCMVYSENILLVGCSDGGLRLIPTQDGSLTSSKPTLWAALQGEASPGISSVNIAYLASSGDGIGRCICSAGGDDGSLSLFELKKVA